MSLTCSDKFSAYLALSWWFSPKLPISSLRQRKWVMCCSSLIPPAFIGAAQVIHLLPNSRWPTKDIDTRLPSSLDHCIRVAVGLSTLERVWRTPHSQNCYWTFSSLWTSSYTGGDLGSHMVTEVLAFHCLKGSFFPKMFADILRIYKCFIYLSLGVAPIPDLGTIRQSHSIYCYTFFFSDLSLYKKFLLKI